MDYIASADALVLVNTTASVAGLAQDCGNSIVNTITAIWH